MAYYVTVVLVKKDMVKLFYLIILIVSSLEGYQERFLGILLLLCREITVKNTSKTYKKMNSFIQFQNNF